MTDQKIELTYDEVTRRAVLKFPNGRELGLGNVTREQAESFAAKHGQEFQKRDCVLHTIGEVLTREASNG
jgi:hypothetical protein